MRILCHQIWRGGGLQGAHVLDFETDGTLRALEPLGDAEQQDHQAAVALAAPAFCDLQVNGSGGVLFNSDPSPDAVLHLIRSQRQRGTGWLMPTLITDLPCKLEQAVSTVLELKSAPGLVGLHIEGPHISTARSGVHAVEYIRPLDEPTIKAVLRLRAEEVPVLLTLAPEAVEVDQVRLLVAAGVTVALGHSSANAEQTERMLEAGATVFTHLYNAMPPMHSRDPGMVGAAIDSDAYVGLIADGFHVDWRMLRLAVRARPSPRRCFLVSDAMPSVGLEQGFELYGQTIELHGGRLCNQDGTLAGAHLDLVTAFDNATRYLREPLAECVAMVSDTPWRVLGLEPPCLQAGMRLGEDLLLLERDPQSGFRRSELCHAIDGV